MDTANNNTKSDPKAFKSERSHEENQERAYIAASRRADRSLEARVQSARMASGIHKKRTGKSFHITEQIVLDEEMYEEEEDNMPRSMRLLGPHMKTDSADLNSRAETFVQNKVDIRNFLNHSISSWKQNNVNREFEVAFPFAALQARRLSQAMAQGSSSAHPCGPSQNHTQGYTQDYTQTHNHGSNEFMQYFKLPQPNENSNFSHMSPQMSPHMSPPGTDSLCEMGHSPSMTGVPPMMQTTGFDHSINFGQMQPESAFTAQLSPEVRMMLGPPVDGETWLGSAQFYPPSSMHGEDEPEAYGTPHNLTMDSGAELDNSYQNPSDFNLDKSYQTPNDFNLDKPYQTPNDFRLDSSTGHDKPYQTPNDLRLDSSTGHDKPYQTPNDFKLDSGMGLDVQIKFEPQSSGRSSDWPSVHEGVNDVEYMSQYAVDDARFDPSEQLCDDIWQSYLEESVWSNDPNDHQNQHHQVSNPPRNPLEHQFQQGNTR